MASALSKHLSAMEKLTLKYWREKYEPIIRAASGDSLSGMKVEIILEDGIVWWAFKDRYHEVVVDQCFHTGDWLRYMEQGNGPHPSVWKRVKAPYFRVVIESTKLSAIQALVRKHAKLRSKEFTSELSWPGYPAAQFLHSRR